MIAKARWKINDVSDMDAVSHWDDFDLDNNRRIIRPAFPINL